MPTLSVVESGTGSRTVLPLLMAAACALAACGGGEKGASPSQASKATWPPRVAPGEMATVAGGGAELGDGGPALKAHFCLPVDIARDGAGNLYVADAGLYCDGPGGNSVRKIDRNGVIRTVAGGAGIIGAAGDGGPAVKAQLNAPLGVAVDREGDIYIADADNFRIRRVDRHGTITTVAGTGRSRGRFDPEHINSAPRARFTGEGGRATDAMLNSSDVTLDADGNLIVADDAGGRVYRVDKHGTIKTLAGTVSGKGRRLGDGGPATSAFLDGPVGVAVDQRGNLLIADHHGERIRKVDARGTITTIAGTGEVKGFNHERGPATKVKLADPAGLALDGSGVLYVADIFNARVREIRYDG